MQCKMFALKMGEKMDDDGYEDWLTIIGFYSQILVIW